MVKPVELSVGRKEFRRALDLEASGRLHEALSAFNNGLASHFQLIQEMKYPVTAELDNLMNRIEEFLDKAFEVKERVELHPNTYTLNVTIKIKNGSIRNSYRKLFSDYFDNYVTRVEIDDAFPISPVQSDSIVSFVELIMEKCNNLKDIIFNIGKPKEDNQLKEQHKYLQRLQNSILKFDARKVQLRIHYIAEDYIHHNEIRIDNGWVIRIDKGLDYFKPVAKFVVGSTNQDLRICNETEVDIYRRIKPIINSPMNMHSSRQKFSSQDYSTWVTKTEMKLSELRTPHHLHRDISEQIKSVSDADTQTKCSQLYTTVYDLKDICPNPDDDKKCVESAVEFVSMMYDDLKSENSKRSLLASELIRQLEFHDKQMQMVFEKIHHYM